jgi:phage terminase large subunit-like protein
VQDVCLGFDGSDSDDWTCIRAETREGVLFTPTYGPDKRPTLWNPAEWGGKIPRAEVNAAVSELFTRYRVSRMYCDPPWWQSEVEAWALEHGEKVVVEWATYRASQMHAALQRFVTDLTTGALTHDDCPTSTLHIANARKAARPGDRYILTKPAGAYHQKIDAAVTSVLAHEAAADARAAGWGNEPESYAYVF